MTDRTFNLNLGPLGRTTVRTDDIEEIDLDQENIQLAGERLTEAKAAEIAREIARKHGRRGGRPPLKPEQRASVQKAVRLTPARAARLHAVATAQGVKEAEIIRQALDAYLAHASAEG